MKDQDKSPHFTADTSDRAEADNYDPHIVPADTAARKEREGDTFKTLPNKGREAEAATNDQTDSGSINTTDGYTVDKEGLVNNYAIEPEMYINEPGDLREKEAELTAERAQEIQDLSEDEQGKLTMEQDQRHRGQGII
ncbi:hypothetical protein IQ264_22370 [Phormidium sp. LEGE 05292]|uniref:hypothetical protein n=1 Tax=[Phormidium] sp. LEGE 05292 TaxID=767427 RepID=UPI001880F530|nr:hypothetical protein [Phormidium sp. LEGE 05292]MBE9228172.1 hypothetical protein [Phormidium sp. LEGE 05292]